MDTLERGSSPTAGDLNDLFDYDIGLDEIVTDPKSDNKATGTGDSTLGLGLDEEVKVTKKRQPVAKLDESRLLSQQGIPKLRHTARQKLRFKGKGHEFKDAARLLSFYQLWLDDLFPRAKFADGLTTIEKLGHSKRIQVMRREWIDEEKPRPFGDSIERDKEVEDPEPNHPADPQGIADQALFVPDPNESTRPTISLPGPEDDDLDELLKEQNEPTADGEAGLQASFLQASDSNGDDYDAEYEAMKELGM